MNDFPRWKVISLHLLLLAGIIVALPSLLPQSARQAWPDFLPSETINLGLDLAGGSHILLEADLDQVRTLRLEQMEDTVRAEMRRSEPRIAISDLSRARGAVRFTVDNPALVDAAKTIVESQTRNTSLTGTKNWNVSVDGNKITITPTNSGLEAGVDDAMESATEVIRVRIDKMGTREPTIVRQGDDRIVVQVPGLDDPEELKQLLGETAKLEFKLVDLAADPEKTREGTANIGSQVLPRADGSGQVAVKRSGGISGENLTKAQQSYDENNQPVVSIAFDSKGGKQFAKLTRENVDKPFAIILDGKVLSTPNIEEPIMGGQSQISGGFTVESANQLAIQLESGALPIDLKVVEERSVGPDLGADSIEAGGIAAIVATVAVLTFMIVTYGRFGVYANLALILNLFLILAIMALMNATLTLPGIAGFVLTVGSAVDANVLINERIREERRRGRRVIQSIEVGYKEASRAIFDANITNIIAGVLLFWFGSGPIRGFAVVLMIGIATSVFTAVVITRMWVTMWFKKKRPTELVI